MATIVIMPKQGLQMEEGLITNWLVEEGGDCVEGKPLFEMETDKLTITMDATASGKLLKILHPEGDSVPITQPIAIIGDEGEDISTLISEKTEEETTEGKSPLEETALESPATKQPRENVKQTESERVFSSPRARMRAEEEGVDVKDIGGRGPEGMVIERDVFDYVGNQTKATPLARRVAETEGLDLGSYAGSGRDGKITAGDLMAQVGVAGQADMGTSTSQVVPLSSMRLLIAQNMKASLDAMAQANHRMDVDMTAAIELREYFKEKDIKVSFNDIIMRCCAAALRDIPEMNASINMEEGCLYLHDEVHIGTAVALPGGGLIVPVVRDADRIGLRGIGEQSRKLIEKARTGQLEPDEYIGGTFTVTSLGMYDVDSFTAIINPPEAGILAVGKIAKKPVVLDDEIVIKSMCTFSLTYDHRIVDGADAARFLQQVKAYLQQPMMLL